MVFSRRPNMKTSTRNEPDDRETVKPLSPPGTVRGKTEDGDPLPLVPGDDRAGDQLPSYRGYLSPLRAEVRLRSPSRSPCRCAGCVYVTPPCARPSVARERCTRYGMTPHLQPTIQFTPAKDELSGLGRRFGPFAGCGHGFLRRLVSSALGAVAIRLLQHFP